MNIKENKVAFDELKLRVEDLSVDEAKVVRFLIARNFNVDKAEEMLRLDIKWRNENNISSYLNWTRPMSRKFIYKYAFEFTGHDFEGSPVIYAPFGRWETKTNLVNGFQAELEAYTYYILESIMCHVSKSGDKPMIFIVDGAETNYWDAAHIPSLQLYYKAFHLFEQHYPEILKAGFVVNTTWLFPYVFNFVKPAFTGTTLKKIKIFDTNREKYLEALLEIMPESSIPSLL